LAATLRSTEGNYREHHEDLKHAWMGREGGIVLLTSLWLVWAHPSSILYSTSMFLATTRGNWHLLEVQKEIEGEKH
jgi:hypothetical protein